MHKVLTAFALLALAISCSSPKKEQATEDVAQQKSSIASNSELVLVFRKIDNRARVFVDDEEIYDSGTIPGNPELDVEIDLTKYLDGGAELLRVDLYNGIEPYTQVDSNWLIVFDIFHNGEVIDFARDSGSDGAVGVVFSETYYFDDL